MVNVLVGRPSSEYAWVMLLACLVHVSLYKFLKMMVRDVGAPPIRLEVSSYVSLIEAVFAKS